MTPDAQFWDRIAPKYAQDPIRNMAAYELTLERTLSYLAPEHNVLELGCGTGSTALLIAPHVRQITGTDLSGEMVRIARAKAEEQGQRNASFQRASAAEALRTDARYDAVLGFNILHLLDNAPARLAEVAGLLPEGGLFISKTPCLSAVSWPKRVFFKAAIAALKRFGKAPSHVRAYTFGALEAEIEAAGFTIVETLSAPAMSRYVVARRH